MRNKITFLNVFHLYPKDPRKPNEDVLSVSMCGKHKYIPRTQILLRTFDCGELVVNETKVLVVIY